VWAPAWATGGGQPPIRLLRLWTANGQGSAGSLAAGEEIVLARAGTPIARLVPFASGERTPGRARGRLTIGVDFDAPLPDELSEAFGAIES
jgi:antitoxin (DNA-binding transcriptional repressor) of toxin-antitoxin stability system